MNRNVEICRNPRRYCQGQTFRADKKRGEVAEKVDVDVRTILNIENHKGNPKWEVPYPLILALKIDTTTLFYPELNKERDDLTRFYLLLGQCTDVEVQTLYSICETVLATLRNNSYINRRQINKNRACSYHTLGSRLCALASGSLLIVIFSFTMFALVSFLHFGQNNGKFNNTVSSYTFVFVRCLQFGQGIHADLSINSHFSQ